MSAETDPTAALTDTGDYLEVPEHERLDTDEHVPAEVNDDEFELLEDVPEGEVRPLSTAEAGAYDDDPEAGEQ